jgi:hypothetical protein
MVCGSPATTEQSSQEKIYLANDILHLLMFILPTPRAPLFGLVATPEMEPRVNETVCQIVSSFVLTTCRLFLVHWRAKEDQNTPCFRSFCAGKRLSMSLRSDPRWRMEARLVDVTPTKFIKAESTSAPSDTSAPESALPGPVSDVLGRGKRPRIVSRTHSESSLDRPAPRTKKLKLTAAPKAKDPTKEAVEAEVS